MNAKVILPHLCFCNPADYLVHSLKRFGVIGLDGSLAMNKRRLGNSS